VSEPERAEGFLDAIVVSFPSSSLFALSFFFLALWAQNPKLILNEDDSSPPIISAL
jgi:hypothetical protein